MWVSGSVELSGSGHLQLYSHACWLASFAGCQLVDLTLSFFMFLLGHISTTIQHCHSQAETFSSHQIGVAPAV